MYFKQGFQHRLGAFAADALVRIAGLVVVYALDKLSEKGRKHNESLDENYHEVSEEENSTNPHNNPISQETLDSFSRIFEKYYEKPAENNEEDK